MGYTHYWNFNKKIESIKDFKNKFKQAVDLSKEKIAEAEKLLIEQGCDKEYIAIKYGDGKGEPVFKENLILFNGNASRKQNYDSFMISFKEIFGFCKTGRMAYDYAVCTALLCFQKVFGEDFSYASDGDIENGEEGWSVAKKVMEGKSVKMTNRDLVSTTQVHSLGDGEWSIEVLSENNILLKEFVGSNGTRGEKTDLWAQFNEWADQEVTEEPKTRVNLEDRVDLYVGDIEKHLISIIKEGQKKNGYINVQSYGNKPNIRAYRENEDGYVDELVVKYVRVREDIIEFIAAPQCIKYDNTDVEEDESLWDGDFLQGDFLYYETILNIANYIQQYIS